MSTCLRGSRGGGPRLRRPKVRPRSIRLRASRSRRIRSSARLSISTPEIKVIGSRFGLDDVLSSRARTDPERSREFASEGLGPQEVIEEDREGRHLRMRLVADSDVPIHEVEEYPRDLLGADDDQKVLPREARQHVLQPLAIHRQMDLRAWPPFQDPSPSHSRLDSEGAAEAANNSPDRSLEGEVPRRHEDRISAEGAGREGDVGRHALVARRTAAQSPDRDQGSVLEPDDPMAPEVEPRGSFHEGLQLRLRDL